jgi:hypothetical protein
MSEPLLQRIMPWVERLRSILSENRNLLLFLALLVFVGGALFSVRAIDLDPSDVDITSLLFLALILTPASLIYGALSMMLMAKGAGVAINFPTAWRISCFAQLAEFLPLPGGAIVRGVGMMQHGTNARDAASHVIINALLWIGLSAIAGGLALAIFSTLGWLLCMVGLICSLACLAWLWHQSDGKIATMALLLRLVGLLLAGIRIKVSFLAIGVAIPLIAAYPFAFAAILGSASALAPGGLGISETLASAIATMTPTVPAAAFLAVGLNRLVGLVVSGVASGILSLSVPDRNMTNG